ncbi:hypothetical protein [Ancylomarina longa]|uniref:Uncharacterized protein n=1 Tax=Ancylomarina longa TaxID=2487017 RepID=A0A434AYS9_9BACT|nr:hypothetical protein [Ancylomarina longa]RUT79779.1 hypothetical protein DLK05_00015 [Ancylomarina longa]
MNKELYILIGFCIFAFLIGQQIKNKLAIKKPIKPKSKSNRKSKKRRSPIESERKQKIKRILTWLMLGLIFILVLFMIPALSRDLLSNGSVNNRNLILRILIVGFAIYILVTGFLKINSSKKD